MELHLTFLLIKFFYNQGETKYKKSRRHSYNSDEAEEAGRSEEEVSGDEEPADGEDIGHSVSLL